MKAPLIHVASMIFNTPLAIVPEKLDVILRALGPRLNIDDEALDELVELHVIRARPVLKDGVVMAQADDGDDDPNKDKPYRLTPEGIAVIPIRGTLTKRFSWLAAASGCSSYMGLRQAATEAMTDPMVKAVMFDVDSPGGTTHGCFELSDALYHMRGDKPMWAVANDLAASAAYALASAADRIFVTRTGSVGSIGVFALHCDQSALDDSMGNKYTYIYAGAKKTDGNPHEPLSKSARRDIQTEVDREYDMFVGTVVRNRGAAGATVGKIQATEAGVFFAENATDLLADEVATFDEAMEMLTKKVTGSKSPGAKIGLQTPAASGNNGGQAGSERGPAGREATMPAIAPHKTATSTKSWDGPANKKRLRQGESASYYRSAYAFAKPDGDPKTKAGYSFIHHEVSSSGDVGAANVKACQTSIGVLNGGRGGTVLKGADRRGVYNHVAKHLRDAGEKPAPLASYQQYISGVLAYAVEQGDDQLHSTALVYLVAGDTGDEQQQEDVMARRGESEDMRRGKKSEAEDADAEAVDAADKKDDDEEDDDDEKERKKDDDDEEAEGKKGESRRGKKSEAEGKRGKKSEGKKDDMDDDDDDDDEDDKKKGRRGDVTELPLAADSDARQIAELCQIAAMPELAAKYIMRGYSVKEVMKCLSARRSKMSAQDPVQSFVPGDQGGGYKGTRRTGIDQLIQQAKTMAANSGGKLTQSQAMEQLLRANPDVYSDYLEERGAVAARAAFTGGGRALTDYVLNNQRRYMANLGLSTVIDEVPARRSM